jgi:hypothetical protein
MPERPLIPSGYWRGHAVSWDVEREIHVYTDTGEPTPRYGGEERPCPFCGGHPDVNRPVGQRPDPCMGLLDGVKSACCGHGVHQGWIRFPNGPTLAVHVDYPGCWAPVQ